MNDLMVQEFLRRMWLIRNETIWDMSRSKESRDEIRQEIYEGLKDDFDFISNKAGN